jgi:hypothetical protein
MRKVARGKTEKREGADEEIGEGEEAEGEVKRKRLNMQREGKLRWEWHREKNEWEGKGCPKRRKIKSHNMLLYHYYSILELTHP